MNYRLFEKSAGLGLLILFYNPAINILSKKTINFKTSNFNFKLLLFNTISLYFNKANMLIKIFCPQCYFEVQL